MAVLHSLGITAVHDFRLMGGLEGAAALAAWQRLRERGDLNLRCWVTLPGEHLEEAIALGLRTGFGDECLRIGHVKFFADGGMGARTAWMIDPYLDAEWGLPSIPMDQLEQKVFNAERAGLSVAVHAVGDRTNHELIRMFAKLQVERNSPADARHNRPALAHRIEHLQMVRAEDLARLARLDVVASMQPHNAILDMAMIDACVGRNGRYTYAFGEVMASGIPVCFSSDAPVCDPNPLVGIHAAVTRQGKDGQPPGGWYPNQRITVAQAVRSYTRTPAWASGVEHEQGSITPGKRADIVILDRDIFESDPMDIINARIILTVFGGRIVHRAAGF
jgi:predicted amidohydrolase YtcJ